MHDDGRWLQTSTGEKKRVSFADNIKLKILHAALLPSTQETSMVCITDGKLFFTLTRHGCNGNLNASCCINELVQGSLCNKYS